jgi:hypothetical protein
VLVQEFICELLYGNDERPFIRTRTRNTVENRLKTQSKFHSKLVDGKDMFNPNHSPNSYYPSNSSLHCSFGSRYESFTSQGSLIMNKPQSPVLPNNLQPQFPQKQFPQKRMLSQNFQPQFPQN